MTEKDMKGMSGKGQMGWERRDHPLTVNSWIHVRCVVGTTGAHLMDGLDVLERGGFIIVELTSSKATGNSRSGIPGNSREF